jgi:hypothetical protein
VPSPIRLVSTIALGCMNIVNVRVDGASQWLVMMRPPGLAESSRPGAAVMLTRC